MKINKEIIDMITEINMKIIHHNNKGSRFKVRFYQSLLSWYISKEFKNVWI